VASCRITVLVCTLRPRSAPIHVGSADCIAQILVNDLVLRFALGGIAVSLFSALAELFKPKTFSGLFGAAPAVALVSLAIAFEQRGEAIVREHALGMVCGGAGFLAYACACVFITERKQVPVWAGAAVCWAVWFLVAAVAWFTVRPS